MLFPAHRDVLAQFAWSNALLAFDFDGTLAPIVDDPAAAHMRPRARGPLSALACLAPVVVISDRGRDELHECAIDGLLRQLIGLRSRADQRTAVR